jgi:tetratricopeptide (TPR) repeat protein
MLGQGAVQDAQGNIVMTNQYMVQHIMQQDALPGGGWKKPPYFAVTVPEHQGFDKQFSLEGLVYRVNPDTTGPEVDEPATHHNMYELFKYRGLFLADGSWDPKVYKDENASTLSRNYAAAHLQLAMFYQQRNELPKAVAEMERVERMFPDFVGAFIPLGKMYMDMGDTLKAHELFARLVKRHPESPEVQFHYGVTSMYLGDRQTALQSFDRSLSLDPEYFYPYVAAYSMLWEAGQHEQALSYLERWLQRHPDDQQVRQVLEANRHDLGAPTPQAAPPPVRPPGMP